jgi:hypothetical protein
MESVAEVAFGGWGAKGLAPTGCFITQGSRQRKAKVGAYANAAAPARCAESFRARPIPILEPGRIREISVRLIPSFLSYMIIIYLEFKSNPK